MTGGTNWLPQGGEGNPRKARENDETFRWRKVRATGDGTVWVKNQANKGAKRFGGGVRIAGVQGRLSLRGTTRSQMQGDTERQIQGKGRVNDPKERGGGLR